jgi:hypothetical protein
MLEGLRRVCNEELHGLDSSGSGWKPVEGSSEYGNEASGSKKCWKILE